MLLLLSYPRVVDAGEIGALALALALVTAQEEEVSMRGTAGTVGSAKRVGGTGAGAGTRGWVCGYIQVQRGVRGGRRRWGRGAKPDVWRQKQRPEQTQDEMETDRDQDRDRTDERRGVAGRMLDGEGAGDNDA